MSSFPYLVSSSTFSYLYIDLFAVLYTATAVDALSMLLNNVKPKENPYTYQVRLAPFTTVSINSFLVNIVGPVCKQNVLNTKQKFVDND